MGYRLNRPIEAATVADALGSKLHGPNSLIDGVAPLSAHGPNELTFAKERAQFAPGSVAIVARKNPSEGTQIESVNPRLDFIRALEFLDEAVGFERLMEEPIIHHTARLGANVVVEPGCVIGAHCVIEPNVVLHAGTRVGKHTRVRSNASIGSDGFGFERLPDGTAVRFPHLGAVVIGDNVEIGSCAAIARGTLRDTIIEDGVKIDNLVHVAHNCVIRRGAFVIACAEVSGGVEIGENAWIAPNASTHQKVTIGAESLVGLGAVVTKDVSPRTVVAGNPARKLRDL